MEAHGHPSGADTVWATVYVQRDDLLETRPTTAAAEGARPPSPRYRARLRFRIASCSMHPTTPAPAILGEVHRRHRAPAAALTDAELERRHGHQRPLRTNGGDPPRPPEVTLRCVRAPRRTEWIPARTVGILRPCAVPVVGGTSRLHERLCMPCQPVPNSGPVSPHPLSLGRTNVHQWDSFWTSSKPCRRLGHRHKWSEGSGTTVDVIPRVYDIEFEIFDSSRMRGDLIEVEFARFETQNEMDARDEPADEMGHFSCRDRKRFPT